MGYEQVSVVDEIMNIVNGIVNFALKLMAIIANFGIEVINMISAMFG